MQHDSVPTFAGFTDGDLCRIDGERGGVFIFKSVAMRDQEAQWVSVVGPVNSQQRMWRSFTADRIRPLSKQRAKVYGGSAKNNEVPPEASVAPPKARTKPKKARIQPEDPEAAPTNVIRAWARANGIEVGDRGRLHPDVIAQYLDSELAKLV